MSDKILSDKDSQVASFIQSQPKEEIVDVNEAHQNLFALPEECEVKSNIYDFRWVAKDTRMLDRSKAKGWMICNSIHTPWIPSSLYAAHGGIEKYGHLLAFRRKEISDIYRKKYQTQSNDNIKVATKAGQKDKDGSPFYTAKLSPDEERNDEGAAKELVQGRDF